MTPDRFEPLDALFSLILADAERTVGPALADYARHRVAELRRLGVADPGRKLVDDVQQYAHDTFLDTTWPACPRHGSHPLWYRDGAWWCDADGVAVAALGELPRSGGEAWS